MSNGILSLARMVAPGKEPEIEGGATGVCVVEGCERERHAKELCSLHYLRHYRHGDVNADYRRKYEPGQKCEVEGCDAPVHAKSKCQNHYMAEWWSNRSVA